MLLAIVCAFVIIELLKLTVFTEAQHVVENQSPERTIGFGAIKALRQDA